jgi:transcriptional regulator with XRE-family HTH domain
MTGTESRFLAAVRAELARAGVTQQDAAKHLGIAKSTFSLKLKGQRPFKLSEIEALTILLNLDPVVLFMPAQEFGLAEADRPATMPVPIVAVRGKQESRERLRGSRKDERSDIICRIYSLEPDRTQLSVALEVGCSPSTVGSIKRQLVAEGRLRTLEGEGDYPKVREIFPSVVSSFSADIAPRLVAA